MDEFCDDVRTVTRLLLVKNMKNLNSVCFILVLPLLVSSAGSLNAQSFTVQVVQPSGVTTPPPVSLVSHTNAWGYHKGTNAPVAGWQSLADAALDASWATGNGGFGYSDNAPETARCQTLLPDMKSAQLGGAPGNYSTLYIRQSFQVLSAVDPAERLILTIDYDDGFVAYLDGVELLRGNAGGTVGVEPGVGALAPLPHESSLGTAGNPPSTNDLGPVGSRLALGSHTLAILGLNALTNSSDFILVADLAVTSPSSAPAPVITGPLAMSITHSNAIGLFGTNSFPGSTRVTVNGADATFNPGNGAWSKTQSLAPGCNRLVIEALNASGATLFSTNHLVVSEMSSTTVNSLSGNTVFDSSMGIIHVDSTLTVPSGASLTMLPGTVVLLGAGINIRATSDATLSIEGTAANPVCLLTADASSMWGEIAADGANSHLTVRHAETIGGAVKGRNGATCLLEDTYFHDYKNGAVPIGGCTSAQSMTVRRCHFRVYHETLWQNTLMTVEGCLFELANNVSSDALDFDGAIVGSVIRRCTFRHGPQSNTDAIDIGPTTAGSGSTNTFIHDNIMFDFPNDKGVSIGEGSYGIVVSNCLMYGNDSGVAVKDSPGGKPPCTANVMNCTIVDCDYAYRCYNKSMPNSLTDGGQITNSYDNILWAPRIATLQILNSGILIADHTDFGGTNWPGTGNFDASPLFLNAAQRDYRLAPNSPCVGTGRNGGNLGVTYPVGSLLAPSHPIISSIAATNGLVKLGFWVDSEKNYSLQSSDQASGGTWTKITDVYHQMCPRFVQVTAAPPASHRFYRLVTPVQP